MEQAWYTPGQIVVEICGCMRHSNGRQVKRCSKHAAEDGGELHVEFITKTMRVDRETFEAAQAGNGAFMVALEKQLDRTRDELTRRILFGE